MNTIKPHYTKPDRKAIAQSLELLKQLNDNDNTIIHDDKDSEQGEAIKDVATLLDGIELPWGHTHRHTWVVAFLHRRSSLPHTIEMF